MMRQKQGDRLRQTGTERKASLVDILQVPTRREKILDLIMTTHPSFKVHHKPLLSIADSDHDIELYETPPPPRPTSPSKASKFMLKISNIKGIKQDVYEHVQALMLDPDPT